MDAGGEGRGWTRASARPQRSTRRCSACTITCVRFFSRPDPCRTSFSDLPSSLGSIPLPHVLVAAYGRHGLAGTLERWDQDLVENTPSTSLPSSPLLALRPELRWRFGSTTLSPSRIPRLAMTNQHDLHPSNDPSARSSSDRLHRSPPNTDSTGGLRSPIRSAQYRRPSSTASSWTSDVCATATAHDRSARRRRRRDADHRHRDGSRPRALTSEFVEHFVAWFSPSSSGSQLEVPLPHVRRRGPTSSSTTVPVRVSAWRSPRSSSAV